MDSVRIKGEWFFEYGDGRVAGPLENFMTSAGLATVAQWLEEASGAYLAVGDDTAPGETITEVFRKAVSAVTRNASLVRFRTQLLAGECNGDHKKACIYLGGSATPGTGTMLNLLAQPWSKTANNALTVECRITVAGVA